MSTWYQDYLRGSWWRRRRASILARADRHCEWCGRYCGPFVPGDDDEPEAAADHEAQRQRLEVHHLNYDRIGAELDSDLVALCESCHDGITEREWFRKMVRAADQTVPRDASHATVTIAALRLQLQGGEP